MVNAEILSIGTELLLGQIANTNAQYLSEELAQLGINCCWHTVVGDNCDRIKQCLRAALNRADLVITTGGLGPTADDLTTDCIGNFFAVPLVFDEATIEKIQAVFAGRGMIMPESNRKQALRPEGSQILSNPYGTAPGIIWEVSPKLIEKACLEYKDKARWIMTFPGVPSEMKAMWQGGARPFLLDKFVEGTIWSCELKHYGIGESALADMYSDLLQSHNPTVAPLAGLGECRLRVTAKAGTVGQAQQLAWPIIEQIRTKSGSMCYGSDTDTLESVVGKMLAERRLTVALAESCTGGLVSKRLTDIPGSSRYVKLNVVSYSNEAKHKLLGVEQAILEDKGSVSLECAYGMALGIKTLAQADIGVGITGIAGPDGGSQDKLVGLVYVALVADCFQTDKTLRFSPQLSRAEIRHRTASEALNMVRLFCLDNTQLAK
ncbi:MAG: competence/damage-inducible protein A [Candidatus Melainabacteria bacterium]|nr:competence/damage-inducible protein A [Candidatus Melainabacteria bacterium]